MGSHKACHTVSAVLRKFCTWLQVKPKSPCVVTECPASSRALSHHGCPWDVEMELSTIAYPLGADDPLE